MYFISFFFCSTWIFSSVNKMLSAPFTVKSTSSVMQVVAAPAPSCLRDPQPAAAAGAAPRMRADAASSKYVRPCSSRVPI